jgi:hypothetical protein
MRLDQQLANIMLKPILETLPFTKLAINLERVIELHAFDQRHDTSTVSLLFMGTHLENVNRSAFMTKSFE